MSEFTDKQINDIFDEEKDWDGQGSNNVDGWSFVKMTESHIEIA